MATSVPQQNQSSTDWQTSKQTVRDRTAVLFNNSLMSDIKFVVTDSQHESDGTKIRVPAHKLVLAISSPVFEAMFYSDLAEKGEEIELQDTDDECLFEFLRFIYRDEVKLTTDNVLGVYYIARKYLVSTLESKCRLFLMENTDESDVCEVLEEAKRFEESELEKRCWEIIDGDKSAACLRSDRILTLSHATLVSLLKRDTLSTQEVHLFKAVKHWAEAKCDERGLERTNSAIREILGDAIDLIRFPTMSRKQLAIHVVPTKILTSEEALELHQYFSGVIPGNLVKFSRTKRRGAFQTLFRCSRFPDGNCGILSPGDRLTETLTFQTDQEVMLSGVHLFAGINPGKRFNAEVRITAAGGTELASAKGVFALVYSGTGYGFDVNFKTPMRVKPLSKYAISATVKSTDGKGVHYSSQVPKLIVKNGSVTVTFERSSRIACQISGLLIYK